MSKNTEILEILQEVEYDDNAEAVIKYLPDWDTTEDFPIKEALRYIKMQQWSYEQFDYAMERVITKVLPNWMIKVFFEMKQFRNDKRNELASTCVVVSKLKGYPMSTQDDKAFCLYEYLLEKYYKEVE